MAERSSLYQFSPSTVEAVLEDQDSSGDAAFKGNLKDHEPEDH